MGVPGERCYYPPEELIWDASHDSCPRSLRAAVAALYGLSPDSLILAKQQPEKWSWEEISNWVKTGSTTEPDFGVEEWVLKRHVHRIFDLQNQQVSKKKRKKKTESLLGAPFHLKDGDTIGVKVLTKIYLFFF